MVEQNRKPVTDAQLTPKEPVGTPEIFLPPNVSLVIFFNQHESRSDLGDFGAFKEKVHSADIFIPEAFGVTKSDLKGFRQLARKSSGQVTKVLESIRGDEGEDLDYQLAIADSIRDSRTGIVMVDVEKDEQITRDLLRFKQSPIAATADFEGAIEQMAKYYRNLRDLNFQREHVILSRIGPKLEEFIKGSDRLRGRKQVNVLMTIGTNHTWIAEELTATVDKQRGIKSGDLPQVVVEFSDAFSPNRADTKLAKHYHPKINFTLSPKDERLACARVLLAGNIHLVNLLKKNYEVSLIDVVELLDIQDLEALFEFTKALGQGGAKYLETDLVTAFPIFGKVRSLILEAKSQE